MGVLEQVLAAVDNAKRVAGRNISDMVSSPAAYAERMTDALRNSNRNVVPTAAQGELTNRPMTRDEINQKFVDASADTLSGGLGVIKPKGGNWLSGKYGPEAQLKALKHQNIEPGTAAQSIAVNDFVDRQLTKYVKNDMASPTDPIRLMADKFPTEKAQKLAEAEARVQALRQKQTAQAATRGVPEEMLTRTRQDVLRAEEARDVIAENQGLHYTPGQWDATLAPGNVIEGNRAQAGFPAEGMATSDLGRAWENNADMDISRQLAKDLQLPGGLKQDPWLAKVDPNTPVYSTVYDAGNFRHLTDELRNSLREGRLTPEQLQKMPIDQAVRHVAEINALRAVEANKTRAMDMADMPVHKEYPDTGMSWRQLKMPDAPKVMSVDEAEAAYQAMPPGKAAEDWIAQYRRDRDAAERNAPGYAKLEKWLKDEGDAMGHCVGGYCDDVASGQSNIYSLRDAKGKPSVTIETTSPNLDTNGNGTDAGIADRIWADASAKFGADAEGTAEFMKYVEDGYRSAAANRAPMIAQIKGKNNAAPPPEALPYIQDFIRSGKWSEIQDAGNTGLTPAELQQILKGTQ